MSNGDRPIDRAREQSLCDFFETVLHAGRTRNSPKSIGYNVCPNCGEGSKKSDRVSVTGDQHWRCFACGAKGSIVDAAMCHYGEKDPLQAALILLGESNKEYAPVQLKKAQPKTEAPDTAPLVAKVIERVMTVSQFDFNGPALRYLTEVRMLPKTVLQQARERGLIGCLPSDPSAATRFLEREVGRELLEDAGMWNPEKQRPAIAYRPLVFFLPGGTSAEFRIARDAKDGELKGIRYGRLEYPWWWSGEQEQMLCVEGFIDFLSAVALGWKGHIMGIPGVGNAGRKEWYERAVTRYAIRRVVVGFDNDEDRLDGNGVVRNAGRDASEVVSKIMTDMQVPFKISPPKAGDMNEALKAKLMNQLQEA